MKKLLLLLLVITAFSCSDDDTATAYASGDIVVNDQQSLDALAAKKYTRIKGNLTITGNLYNLDGLETITEITGNLVLSKCYTIENIDGLKNLTSTGSLEISETSLTDLNLTSLINTGEYLVVSENSLVNVSGLKNLKEIKKLVISGNMNLSSLHGFESVTSAETIEITRNHLSDLKGFESLTKVQALKFDGDAIVSLEALQNLHSVSFLHIQGLSITSLNGLQNVNELADLSIIDNKNLLSLNGLENLHSLTAINITGNTHLLNISALSGVTSLGDDLNTDGIIISECYDLTTLDGLQNISQFKGKINIYGYESLKDFCALKNILENGDINTVSIVRSNGLPVPSVEDIIAGNCTVE